MFEEEYNLTEEQEIDDEEVGLCFIRLVGEENDALYRYEFIFTNNVDECWGEGFDEKPACLVNNLMINDEYITEIHVVRTKIKLDLIQNNCCFSVSDCFDGIVALAWPQDIETCDLYFKFGEAYNEIEKKLAKHSILLG